MAERQARVALLVTCLVDLFRPTVGFAAVKLLEEAGCAVEVPRAQTCCGQPAYNSGDRADAKAIARQVIDAFAGYRLCRRAVGLVRRHDQAALSRAVRRRPGNLPRAKELAARTCELVSFLVDVRGMSAWSRQWRADRDLSRCLLGPARARGQGDSRAACSPRSRGCTLRELPGAEVCCGFGGTFCVKYPEISDKMVERQGRRHRRDRRR